MRERRSLLNGGLTDAADSRMSYEDAKAEATESSRSNAWNVNGNGNVNNNNRCNQNYVLAVAACESEDRFLQGVTDAFEDCSKKKRSKQQYVDYVPHAAQDLLRLSEELKTMTWKPSASQCFMVRRPKLRECFAAAYRDRIVHHWITARLMPLFERRCDELGNVSHACRKSYGTATAIRQVEVNMERVSKGYTKEAWVLRLDIVGCFMAVSQEKLLAMIRELIEKDYHGSDKAQLLYACETCIMHRPEEDCTVENDPKLWDELPKHKSMFYGDKHHGEPIGNVTTQHFIGYYLSWLDELTLRWFEGKNFGYTRSVDDFCVVCDDRLLLKRYLKELKPWLMERLELSVHEDSVYLQKVSHGVKFLGEWIKAHRRYSIKRNTTAFMDNFRKVCERCEHSPTLLELAAWENSINSRLGGMRSTRSYGVRRKMLDVAGKGFFKYYTIANLEKIRLRKQYRLLTT